MKTTFTFASAASLLATARAATAAGETFKFIRRRHRPHGPRKGVLLGLLLGVPLLVCGVDTSPALAAADLRVMQFRVLGNPSKAADGSFLVRAEITVVNKGGSTAGRAKIAAFAIRLPSRQAVNVPFDPERSRYRAFAWTSPLPPGAGQRFVGHVRLLPSFVGARVKLFVVVDSMAGEEFANPSGRVREASESNNRSAYVTVALPGRAASIRDAGPNQQIGPPAAVSPAPSRQNKTAHKFQAARPKSKPEKWAITLRRFVVWHATERRGDDPMLIPLVFRVRLGDPNSARVHMDPAPIKPGSNMRSGQIVRIGPSHFPTRYRFAGVRRVTDRDLEIGVNPEILGMIVIAVEDNGTPDGRVMQMVSRALRPLEQHLNRLVGRWDAVTNPNAVRNAIITIQQQLQPTISQAIGIGIESGFDVDQFVAIQAVTFLTVDDRNPPQVLTRLRIPVGTLRPVEMSWNSRTDGPITLQKDRRIWKLEVSIAPAAFTGRGTI